MAYTTNELITSAYYKSGVVSRDFENVDGSQISLGLELLNEALSITTLDSGLVPYETTYNFTAVSAQEAYPIDNLIKIDTLVFYLDTVRYSMTYTKRNDYFGSTRAENIQSLPYEWYFERGLGGGTLYMYFSPDQAYPCEIHGIFRLAQVALNQDLQLTLDTFYINYLKYKLTMLICNEYNRDIPPEIKKMCLEYEGLLRKKSNLIDLRLQKQSTLNNYDTTLNWAYVNLGRGFIPY